MQSCTKEVIEKCLPFSCGDDDLDDFFLNDAILYKDELLGKSYCWVTKDAPHRIIAFFTLANGSIKTKLMSSNDKNRFHRNIVNSKRGHSYPALLIGRLGVNMEFQGNGNHVGSHLLDFIKDWYKDENNRASCRFIIVDALNNERVLSFYKKNGFVNLYKTEETEKHFSNIPQNDRIKTRMMYFDLKN